MGLATGALCSGLVSGIVMVSLSVVVIAARILFYPDIVELFDPLIWFSSGTWAVPGGAIIGVSDSIRSKPLTWFQTSAIGCVTASFPCVLLSLFSDSDLWLYVILIVVFGILCGVTVSGRVALAVISHYTGEGEWNDRS